MWYSNSIVCIMDITSTNMHTIAHHGRESFEHQHRFIQTWKHEVHHFARETLKARSQSSL